MQADSIRVFHTQERVLQLCNETKRSVSSQRRRAAKKLEGPEQQLKHILITSSQPLQKPYLAVNTIAKKVRKRYQNMS